MRADKKGPLHRVILVNLALLAAGAALAGETPAGPGAPGTQAGAPETAPARNIKYKSGKDVNFEELLIQGQLKRPEITVVTGDASQGTDGLLRLRTNFLDRMASDIGEVATP